MSYVSAPEAYELMLADIETGARLHYEAAASGDPDLDLLTGDERYADGLVKLAALQDLQATRILGDAISAIAQARAAGDAAAARSVWEQAVQAVRTKR
jgi:hypothetical protein